MKVNPRHRQPPYIHATTQQGSNVRITVPVHANQDLKIGLQRAIMKLAGISEDEL